MAAEEFSSRAALLKRMGELLDSELSNGPPVVLNVRQHFYANGGRRYVLDQEH